MCQYGCEEGLAADWHLMHVGQLAMSGAALFILEATAVTRKGRITPGCLGLWRDEHEAALARVLAAVRRHSAMPIGIRLAHAGRKASSEGPWRGGMLIPPAPASLGGWVPLAPSGPCRTPRASQRRWRWTRPASRASARAASMPPGARTAWASPPSSCTRRTATGCTSSSRR